jgi:hypothetical protein
MFVIRVTRRVPYVVQELLTLPADPSSLPDFSGVRVAPSLVFYPMFCRSLFVPLSFSFGHCVVCPSLIDVFWLPPLLSSKLSHITRLFY